MRSSQYTIHPIELVIDMRETPRGSTRCADLCGAVEVVHDREQHKRVHNHGLIRHVCVSRVRCGAAITNDRLQRGRKEDRRGGSSFCFWPLPSLTLCCDTRRCQHARYRTSRRSERSVLRNQACYCSCADRFRRSSGRKGESTHRSCFSAPPTRLPRS